jgi:hypothetical protein
MSSCLFEIVLSTMHLKKPDKSDFLKKQNQWLGKIAECIKAHGGDQVIPFTVAYEAKALGYVTGGSRSILR